jgi:hypothetical protein
MNSERALYILKKNDPINGMNLLIVTPLSGFHCIMSNVSKFPQKLTKDNSTSIIVYCLVYTYLSHMF